MSKAFKLGIVVGRFQLLHKGHEYIINRGLELCDKFVVYVGSSQESDTEKNPFNYEFRATVLREIYGDRIEIRPIPDRGLGNNSSWGKYVLTTVMNDFGDYPDLIVTGNEGRRQSWFNDVDMPNVSELILNKSNVLTSSSDLKKYLTIDDREMFETFTNPKIHKLYDVMRSHYLKVADKTETRSI